MTCLRICQNILYFQMLYSCSFVLRNETTACNVTHALKDVAVCQYLLQWYISSSFAKHTSFIS